MCVTSGGSGFLLFVWMETDGVFCDFFVETLANSKIMRTFVPAIVMVPWPSG